MTQHYTLEQINQMDRKFRLNLMNCVSGLKPVVLVGTQSPNGISNLAMISSVVHLGAHPPLIGFIMRPTTAKRDTYNNLLEHPYFTINMVKSNFIEKAHYTSAKFDADVSEFDACGFNEEFHGDFSAPYVAESELKIGLKFIEEQTIEANGTRLIIGEVQHLFVPGDIIQENGRLKLEDINAVSVAGLNKYYNVDPLDELEYARVENIPNFTKTKKRPDNVVYNDQTQSYEAAIKPYATNLGAPVIEYEDVSTWKNRGINRVNHHLKTRFDSLKTEYDKMVETHYWNDLLYRTKFSFEPVIGEIYHLYKNKKGKLILSLIEPNQWKQEHLGTFRLDTDQMWHKIDIDN